MSSESSQSSQSDGGELNAEELEQLAQVQDEQRVDKELKNWVDDGIIDDIDQLNSFDLVGYWDASVRNFAGQHIRLVLTYTAEHSRTIPAHFQGRMRRYALSSLSRSLRTCFFVEQGDRLLEAQ
jgi:hypothetical protein